MGKHSYGVLPSLFWGSDTGRQIQTKGLGALVLSSYLRANRHDTMLGLYRLRLGDIQVDLPVMGSADSIRASLDALEQVGFSMYDDLASCIWVVEMARERMNLQPGRVLDPEDNRSKGAQKLYDMLPPTRLFDPFYNLYGRVLRLKRRLIAQPSLDDVSPYGVPTVSPTGAGQDAGVSPHHVPPRASANRAGDQIAIEAPYKPLTSPFEGASSAGVCTAVPDLPDQDLDQQERSEDQVRRSARTAAASPRLPALLTTAPAFDDLARQPSGTNYPVVARCARGLLEDPDLATKYLGSPVQTLEDLIEATKHFCARKKIDYGRRDPVPCDVVHRACASEWLKFRRPDITSGAAPRPRELNTNPLETTRGTYRRTGGGRL